MRKVLGFGTMVSLSLVASAAAEVETTRMIVKGDALSSQWRWSDDCTSTSVVVWGGEEVANSGSGQPAYATHLQVDVTVWNRCTGRAQYAIADYTSGLAIDGVDSATVETPVTFYEEVCTRVGTFGWTCEIHELDTVTLSVTYTGSGETATGRYVTSSTTRGRRSMVRSAGKWRDAIATGSLVFDGVELLQGDVNATLQEVSSGVHTITRY